MSRETPLDNLFDAIHGELQEMDSGEQNQTLEDEHLSNLFEKAQQCLEEAFEKSPKFKQYVDFKFKPRQSTRVRDRYGGKSRSAPFYLLGLENVSLLVRNHVLQDARPGDIRLFLVVKGPNEYSGYKSIAINELTARQKHELGKILSQMQTPEGVMKVLIELFERKE